MPDNVDLIVMACVVLHNFLTEQRDLPALYQRLNPDNLPYLRDDGAIPAVLNLHGYYTPAQAKQLGTFTPPTSIIQKEHSHGSTEQHYSQTYLQILVTVVAHGLICNLHPLQCWRCQLIVICLLLLGGGVAAFGLAAALLLASGIPSLHHF